MSTARIAMWKELNTPYIYTLESSFLGPANNEGKHFSSIDLMEIGKNLCQTITVFGKLRIPIAKALKDCDLTKSALTIEGMPEALKKLVEGANDIEKIIFNEFICQRDILATGTFKIM